MSRKKQASLTFWLAVVCFLSQFRAQVSAAPAASQPAVTPTRLLPLHTRATLPDYLLWTDGAKETPAGIRFEGREIIRTVETDFISRDFVWEVEVEIKAHDGICFVGLGRAEPGGTAGEPKGSIFFRLHDPTAIDGGVIVARGPIGPDQLHLGNQKTPGTHLLRVEKKGPSVTFSLFAGFDGRSGARPTLTKTIDDIRKYAPDLNDGNTHLFFGGGGTFKAVHIEGNDPAIRAGVATPVEPEAGKAPPLTHDTTQIELGGTLDLSATGGGGRFYVLRLKDSEELMVLDAVAGRIVKKISAPGDVRFTASRNKLVVVSNTSRVIQRWDLETLLREKSVLLADALPVRGLAMGAAGNGPLCIWTSGKVQLLDLNSLRPLTVRGDLPEGTEDTGLSASADGLTFSVGTGGPIRVVRLSNLTAVSVDSRITTTPDPGENEALPNADGSLLVRWKGNVDRTADMAPLDSTSIKGALLYPSQDPRFLVSLRAMPNKLASDISILSAADLRVLYTIQNVEPVMSAMIGGRGGRRSCETRVRYIPDENLIVSFPDTADRVVFRRFDLSASLKALGADYLFIISMPPSRASAGAPFTYQVQTLGNSPAVRFKLEQARQQPAAPAGTRPPAATEPVRDPAVAAVGENIAEMVRGKIAVEATHDDPATTNDVTVHVIDAHRSGPTGGHVLLSVNHVTSKQGSAPSSVHSWIEIELRQSGDRWTCSKATLEPGGQQAKDMTQTIQSMLAAPPAAADRDGPAPATVPAAKRVKGPTAPKTAALKFYAAFRRGDMAGMKMMSVGMDKDSEEGMRDLVTLYNAYHAYLDAMAARFGKAAAKLPPPWQGADSMPEYVGDEVDENSMTRYSDDAVEVLDSKDPDMVDPTRLIQDGNDWKVDLSAADLHFGAHYSYAAAVARAVNSVTLDVKGGKYGSAQAATAAVVAQANQAESKAVEVPVPAR